MNPINYITQVFSRVGLTASLVMLMFLTLPSAGQELSAIPAAFAEIGIGARAASLGYTGTASERGPGAMSWNPSSIYSEEGWELALSYVDQLQTVEFGYAALTIPLRENRNALAVSAHYSGDDALTEESVKVAYAHRIRFVWFGVAAGVRRAVYGKNTLGADDFVVFEPDEIAEGLSRQVRGSATGFMVEAGLRMRWTDDLTYAFTARNIASPLTWKSTSQARAGTNSYVESVPVELATGVDYRLTEKVTGSIEWVPAVTVDAISRVGMGAEFSPIDVISFRVGRSVLHDGLRNEINTFGFGIRTPKSVSVRLRADYAYVTSDLARTQQLSINVGL